MICALLILQEPELPLPLDTLSPWIDMVTRARTDVFADLEAQTHRRFIKTHTPLDGIPSDPVVTYICVGRDPRDVGLSMDRHIGNTDIGAFLAQRERAAAIDGIEPGPLRPPRPRPGGERDRFWQWADDETPFTQVGSSLRRTVEHLATFRDAAGDLDVVYVHYDDLKADLEGQMRQMAARLGIDVGEHRWPRLVQAATFESMRSRACMATVPGGGPEHWTDPAAFFSRGNGGPVARPPRPRLPRPVRRARAGARVRQPRRVGASRAGRLRSPSGGIPALPKADRQRLSAAGIRRSALGTNIRGLRLNRRRIRRYRSPGRRPRRGTMA